MSPMLLIDLYLSLMPNIESASPVPGAYENNLEPVKFEEGYVSVSVNSLSSGSYNSNKGS